MGDGLLTGDGREENGDQAEEDVGTAHFVDFRAYQTSWKFVGDSDLRDPQVDIRGWCCGVVDGLSCGRSERMTTLRAWRSVGA